MALASFKSAGETLLQQYRDRGRDFLFNSRPYWSTITVVGYVTDPFYTNKAHVVIPRNQRIQAFDFGIGQNRPDGFGGFLLANYSDTNLTQARHTNGTEDVVIQSLRVSVRDVRGLFPSPLPFTVTDPVVTRAYAGRAPIMDISSAVRPAEFDSPARLEDSLGRLIRPRLSMAFVWDGEQTTRIGLASHCPDQQSASLLTSAGLPTENNRYDLPEGWAWLKTGSQQDTELNLQVATEEDTVFVISGTPVVGTNPQAYLFPSRVAIDLLVEVGGFTLKYESQN